MANTGAVDIHAHYFPDSYIKRIGVACLAMPEMLVEIEGEASIESERLRVPNKQPFSDCRRCHLVRSRKAAA